MKTYRLIDDLENSLRGCVKSLRSCGVSSLRFEVDVSGVSVVAYDVGGNYISSGSYAFSFVRGRLSAFADLYISYFGVDALRQFLNGLL